MPGPGNIQHLAYVAAKEKKFYDEMGLTNVNIVVLRGNAMNVQALLSGSVHYSSAFGPSMQAMFKGEQIRVLLQIFNQIPFGLITRPDIKRLEDLKGQKIAVTFGTFGSGAMMTVRPFANFFSVIFGRLSGRSAPGEGGVFCWAAAGNINARLSSSNDSRVFMIVSPQDCIFTGPVSLPASGQSRCD